MKAGWEAKFSLSGGPSRSWGNLHSLILPAYFPLCLSVCLHTPLAFLQIQQREGTEELPGEPSSQVWSGTILVRKVILSVTLSWPRSQSYSRCRPLLILPTPGQRMNDNKPVCLSGGRISELRVTQKTPSSRRLSSHLTDRATRPTSYLYRHISLILGITCDTEKTSGAGRGACGWISMWEAEARTVTFRLTYATQGYKRKF